MTDQKVIEAIKVGDRRAEREMYLGNKSKCLKYAQANFFWKQKQGEILRCSHEDAEELYNDACAIFIQNILREHIDRLNIKISTYLIKTMQYSWYNKARARKSVPSEKPEEPSAEIVESMRLKVRHAIGLLDEKCREMMTYRYILGWEDYDDIANATGKNNGAVVRNLISRCRKKFRLLYLQAIHPANTEKSDRS